MTQPSNDPWAAASATAQTGPPADENTSLSDSFAPTGSGTGLFDEDTERADSLFTLNHAPGTKIKVKITAEPREVHSTCHPSQSPDKQSRLKQYWMRDPNTGKRAPGLAEFAPDGSPNDKVENLVITGQTDERNPAVEGDDGRRSWFVSGSKYPPKGHKIGEPVLSGRIAVKDAIRLAIAGGMRMTCEADLVGKTIEVHRVRRLQPGVTTSSWLWQARFVQQ